MRTPIEQFQSALDTHRLTNDLPHEVVSRAVKYGEEQFLELIQGAAGDQAEMYNLAGMILEEMNISIVTA